MFARMALRTAQLGLAILITAYLLSFADHARLMLGFAHPLDYGEGPLLAQVDQLRAGKPIWELYTNPSVSPYLIINYPPLYLLLCAGLTTLTGSALVAGRLISLLATFATVAAIASLARRRSQISPMSAIALSLLFLCIPIVREWSALMRVDMLGLSLGLWGLVALGQPGEQRRPLLAGLLLLASLFTKPSLLAAPAAAGAWLLWDWLHTPRGGRRPQLRTLLILGGTLIFGGGLLFGLLQWASNGWFALHVVSANANRWDATLAWGFWEAQIRLRWALAAAALLLGSAAWLRRDQYQPVITLALLYTLAGALTAVGVGKVGAYSNYFLELYAGLVWMIAGLQPANARLLLPATHRAPPAAHLLPLVSCLFLIVALLYYPPLWDPDRPRQAGLLAPSPPRIIFGRYGLWDDARREADLLAAFGRVDLALEREVRATGSQIFTDMPGTAAAAGVVSRMQVFEARQLLDQGLDEQFNLLADLADGSPPLAVIDYLGNWLTPEIIAVLRHRYAQDGSLGTFNLYRPVDTGPSQLLNSPVALGSNLMLSDYALAAPLSAAYEPGELLTLALGWQYVGTTPPDADLAVVVQLTAPGGGALLEDELPLLYNAFPPDHWPAGRTIQHLQTLALPDELPPGHYGLAVGLRAKGLPLEEPYPLIEIVVQAAGGRTFAETSYFVPAPIMRTWAELGAIERMGLPLTPAVPFAWGQLQCFELACLELRDNTVQLRNVGEQLYLSETARSTGCPDKTLESGLCEGFAELAERYGVSLGTPVSGAMDRNGWIVQWTKNARLERWPAKGMQGLGRLGDESLRLSPGERYRWP